MKTKLIITALLIAAITSAKAQQQQQRLPPPDTSFFNAVGAIAKDAIKVISDSNIPAKTADDIRQRLQAVTQVCEAYRLQLIADEKKKQAVVPVKKP